MSDFELGVVAGILLSLIIMTFLDWLGKNLILPFLKLWERQIKNKERTK